MKINKKQVIAYLKSKGWKEIADFNGFNVWGCSDHEEQFHIPIPDTEIEEHSLYEIVLILTQFEGRQDYQIVKDMMQCPNCT